MSKGQIGEGNQSSRRHDAHIIHILRSPGSTGGKITCTRSHITSQVKHGIQEDGNCSQDPGYCGYALKARAKANAKANADPLLLL